MIPVRALPAACLAGLIALAGAAAGDACAQQIYKIIGPDGRVTFSDKPPADANAKATSAPVVTMSTGTASLPFELRQAASRYPVTLYSSPSCGPCAAGRSFLMNRGVPFTEKSVSTNDDIEALKRLTGAATIPMLSVGSQQLKGFSESEWSQFLDAAAYPKVSQLPRSYIQPPALPLVVVQSQPQAQPQDPAAAGARSPERRPPPVPLTPPTDNPAGITF